MLGSEQFNDIVAICELNFISIKENKNYIFGMLTVTLKRCICAKISICLIEAEVNQSHETF